MTVQHEWVWFFMGVSALSLLTGWLFARRAAAPATQQIPAQTREAGLGVRMKSSLFSARWVRFAGVIATLVLLGQGTAFAQAAEQPGGEANLKLPDLTQVQFLGGINGHALLMYGPLACILGMLFGFFMYVHLKGLPVHRAM